MTSDRGAWLSERSTVQPVPAHRHFCFLRRAGEARVRRPPGPSHRQLGCRPQAELGPAPRQTLVLLLLECPPPRRPAPPAPFPPHVGSGRAGDSACAVPSPAVFSLWATRLFLEIRACLTLHVLWHQEMPDPHGAQRGRPTQVPGFVHIDSS